MVTFLFQSIQGAIVGWTVSAHVLCTSLQWLYLPKLPVFFSSQDIGVYPNYHCENSSSWTCHWSITRLTLKDRLISTHAHTCGQFRMTYQLNESVLGRWGEAGANQHMLMEKMQGRKANVKSGRNEPEALLLCLVGRSSWLLLVMS